MAAAASGLLSWLVGSAPSREFTAEELYASKDEGKMYVALNGRVYDVNPRPDMCGRAASTLIRRTHARPLPQLAYLPLSAVEQVWARCSVQQATWARRNPSSRHDGTHTG
jgi:hypothetical protein